MGFFGLELRAEGLNASVSLLLNSLHAFFKSLFIEKGYEHFLDSPTNQQFIILPQKAMDALADKVAYEIWERLADGRAVTRFATSGATTPTQVEELKKLLPDNK